MKPTNQNTATAVSRLRELVSANSRRWKAVILLEALGLAIAAPLAYLWLVLLLDNYWHLSMFGRVLAGLGFLAGSVGAITHLVKRWRSVHLTEDEVALAIERSTLGGVQNRLINAIQLSRAEKPNEQELSEAAIAENCDHLQQIHLKQAAQMRPAIYRMGLAGLLICAGVAFWLIAPAHFSNAATRILLPFANIDPLYRTIIKVDPGNMHGSGNLKIRITIEGERPRSLIVFKNVEGKRTSESIAVDDEGPIAYTFLDVRQNLEFAIRGGDFTTPYYRIDVPRKATLNRVRITYRYPSYTEQPERSVETRTGDLEALIGTQANVTFVFDQPVDDAAMLMKRAKHADQIRQLTKDSPTEFSVLFPLEGAGSYHLETKQGDQPKELSKAFMINVLKHGDPKLELSGLEPRSEVPIDALIPLKVSASDDYGLKKVGLFYRRMATSISGGPNLAKTTGGDDGWQPIQVWDADRKKLLPKKEHNLTVAEMLATEGEKLELALRAINTDPIRRDVWFTGPIFEMNVGGDGVALQLQYERIVQSEKELRKLLLAEQESLTQTIVWLRKLDAGGDIRWDDPKNIDALHKAVAAIVKDQAGIQKDADLAANNLLPQTGNLKISLTLLASTEVVRLQRIYDAVPSREKPNDKRAALADARVTQERIIRSMEELIEQHQAFRSDWELNNMIPFTKMLAERQTKMRNQSRKFAGEPNATRSRLSQDSMSRRQVKVSDLVQLIQPAFVGLAVRLDDQEPGLSKAFLVGSRILASETLRKPLAQAANDAQTGRWADAVQQQTLVANQLTALHDQLRKAQIEAAQRALAALKEKAKSDLEAQRELEKLEPGTNKALLKDFPENLKLEDLMRIQEVSGAKKRTDKNLGEEPNVDVPLLDIDRSRIELKEDSGVRQDPYSLKLAKEPGKTPILKNLYKAAEKNVVKPFVQESFDDLVGKLLDETEELGKKYQSLTLSTNQNNNDPGEVSKVGGALNSTGAVTATGNQKPPTTESGGLSRTGRQGARAYGMVADDEGVDRRGRDKALDGQEQVADQAGSNRMKKSDDMQKDISTGVGGKRVESDDNHFSLHDSGKWKDDFLKRMEKPQKKQYIVERQGDKIDARTAMLLRDLTSKQEQVIQRLKAIKKELRNLYLPTDHLDDLAAQLETNLATLREQPDPELFRQQMQTLDRLRGAMRVFQSAGAGLQLSTPQERAIRGRILDEPASQPLPGYEDAVRQYYLKLAGQ